LNSLPYGGVHTTLLIPFPGNSRHHTGSCSIPFGRLPHVFKGSVRNERRGAASRYTRVVRHGCATRVGSSRSPERRAISVSARGDEALLLKEGSGNVGGLLLALVDLGVEVPHGLCIE
jgi:hypothetical protein